jgi:hypothetical protein
MRRLLSLALCFVLTGCAATSVNESRRANIQNVAIISAIGDDFGLTRIGLIAFSNEWPSEKMAYGLDRVAQQTAEQVLRERRPDAKVISVQHDSNTLSSKINQREPFQSYADPKRIEPELRQLVQGTPADTIIVVARARESTGPRSYEGIGIYTERTLRERAMIIPYAGISVFIVDARSFEVLAKGERIAEGAAYNINPLITSMRLGGPAPFLAGFAFPLNDEQRRFLDAPMKELVAATVRRLVEQTAP